MLLRSATHRSPAVWLSPILILLAMLLVQGAVATPDPYPLALTTAGAFSILLVGPASAACGAWEGSRLSRSGWFALPHVRSQLAVALAALTPTLAVAWTVVVAVVVVTQLRAGVVALPDPRVIGATLAIVAAHALIGFAVGTATPAAIAAPMVLVAGYAWMAMPAAFGPLWLRHLTGAWEGCCDVAETLAPRAVVGALVLAVGVAGSALLLMGRPVDIASTVLATLPAVVGLVASLLLVRGMGAYPVIEREPSALTCAAGPPRVCVWPEHRARLAETAAVAADVVTAWAAVGVNVPLVFTEQRTSTLPSEARSFGIWSGAERRDIVAALSSSMLPPVPECAVVAGERYPGGVAAPYVEAWFLAHTGPVGDEQGTGFPPRVAMTLGTVLSLPIERQLAWLEQNLRALGSCNVEPRLEPEV